jgi:hypothetical protein
VPQPTLTSATVDLAPLNTGPSLQTVAEPERAAAHGTPSAVLDRVFADLDSNPLADALQERWTPGATG